MNLLITILVGLLVLMVVLYVIRILTAQFGGPPFTNIAVAIVCLIFIVWVLRVSGIGSF